MTNRRRDRTQESHLFIVDGEHPMWFFKEFSLWTVTLGDS